MLSDEKAATLPRKSGGMFVKAHQNGIRNRNIKQNQIKESFVDGTMEEEKAKTQTLPRSYKTGSTKNRTVPDVPNAVINRAQSTNNVMDHGIHLVVSSNSFVSRQKQQIRPVLTVQEKLAQDIPSLPPQVKKCSFKITTTSCDVQQKITSIFYCLNVWVISKALFTILWTS